MPAQGLAQQNATILAANVPVAILAPEPRAGPAAVVVRPIIRVRVAERRCRDRSSRSDRRAGYASGCSNRATGNIGRRADGPAMIAAMGSAIVARRRRRCHRGRHQGGCRDQFPTAHKCLAPFVDDAPQTALATLKFPTGTRKGFTFHSELSRRLWNSGATTTARPS